MFVINIVLRTKHWVSNKYCRTDSGLRYIEFNLLYNQVLMLNPFIKHELFGHIY